MSKLKSPLPLFFITVIVIALLAFFGPEEKSLGANVRIVYLHGAWVLAAELAFVAAALAGVIAFITKRDVFHRWSAALGRTGIFFWITYIPLSLWAMESNWNGLFLAEPRFRLALIFAVTGILLQVGLWIINVNWLTSFANIIFIVVLRVIFSAADNVMHPPPSPIFNSGNFVIIGFFLTLIALTLLAACFLFRFFLGWKPAQQA
ncbi:MAG TPA: hypothetical protein VK909_11645 [Anaerolineales bacterium]|nr:hypothetical protein [Anaerolineales bacterium]